MDRWNDAGARSGGADFSGVAATGAGRPCDRHRALWKAHPRINNVPLALALAAANDSIPLQSFASRPALNVAKEIIAAIIGGFAAGAYLRASQLFPNSLSPASLASEHSPVRRWPTMQRALGYLLHPSAGWTIGAVWAVVSAASQSLGPSMVVVAIGALFFFIQWRVGSPIARRRVAWLMQAVLVFVILMGLQLLVDGLGPHGRQFRLRNIIAYDAAATIFAQGCFAMAVFAAGAFNSALVVRATVAWAAAVAVLLFVINVVASALVDKLADLMGIGDRLLAATLGTLAGLALNPVASGLRAWAQRRGAEA